METIEALRRRIGNTQDLQSLVKTMKVLAAVSIRQYERAVESLAEYNRTIEMGLHVVLRNRPAELAAVKPADFNRLGAVVFGSDQGLCGQFNERIASYAVERMSRLRVQPEERVIVAVGARVAARLEEARQPVEGRLSVPGSIAGITPMVQEILLQIETWHARHSIDQVFLFYNQPLSGATYHPQAVRLLPIDQARLRSLEEQPWPSRVQPTFTMDWNGLFSALIHHYLFVSLYRAFVESLASENASRLAAMQAAERNIEERLGELEASFHHQRQSLITSELLDIVSGFEALTGARAE